MLPAAPGKNIQGRQRPRTRVQIIDVPDGMEAFKIRSGGPCGMCVCARGSAVQPTRDPGPEAASPVPRLPAGCPLGARRMRASRCPPLSLGPAHSCPGPAPPEKGSQQRPRTHTFPYATVKSATSHEDLTDRQTDSEYVCWKVLRQWTGSYFSFPSIDRPTTHRSDPGILLFCLVQDFRSPVALSL